MGGKGSEEEGGEEGEEEEDYANSCVEREGRGLPTIEQFVLL